jgi:hypothetical protein
MLKVSAAVIEHFAKQCPGVAARIEGFERAAYPACAHCGSGDTAIVLWGYRWLHDEFGGRNYPSETVSREGR